jgi:TonB family protein
MRRTMRGIAILGGLLALSCQHEAKAPAAAEDIRGIQIATDAYVAYQHADCETVYQLTQPAQVDAMQATELRYSLRLVRGFCQEQDGDQPAARVTYHRVVDEGRATSFAAADARERLRILDLLADDPDYARRVEAAQSGLREPAETRDPVRREKAVYPPLARASGIEGFAVVEFGVSRQGRTVDPVIVDSEPPFVFDGAALRAVRRWEYKIKRRADKQERHVIRMVFRTALDPVLLEGAEATAPGGSSSKPPSGATGTPAPGNQSVR